MTGYDDWIRQMRRQQKSTWSKDRNGLPWPPPARPKPHVDDDVHTTNEGKLPFNRRRIIALAIREVDFLERWIDDRNTPRNNLILFRAKLPQAMINRDRALALKAKLPPEWTGPQQPSML